MLQSVISNAAYRQFRASVLSDPSTRDACRSTLAPELNVQRPCTAFATGRVLIQRFRESVQFWVASGHVQIEPALARRALRIPAAIPLDRLGLLEALVLSSSSDASRLRALQRLLRDIGTFEGRHLVYKLRGHALNAKRTNTYTDAADYVFMRFAKVPAAADLAEIWYVDVDVLRVGVSLGMKDAAEFLKHVVPLSRRLPNGILRAVTRKGLIRSVDELSLLNDERYRWRNHYEMSPLPEEIANLCESIDILAAHGVGRLQLLCLLARHHWRPDALRANLSLLHARGVDIPAMFSSFPELLCEPRAEGWSFVLDVIGAHSAEQIKAFETSLREWDHPSLLVVQRLREAGFDLDSLALCQKVLCDAASTRDVLQRLDLLLVPPWSLSAQDLQHAGLYLTRGTVDQLGEHMQLLEKHGLADKANLNLFQPCFPQSIVRLNRLLNLALPRQGAKPLAAVAEWIEHALVSPQSVDMDSLEYLVRRFKLSTLEQLRRAVKLATLCSGLLQFLVEERHLDSIGRLHEWYGSDAAFGAHELRFGAEFGVVERTLAKDAFDRRSLTPVTGNWLTLAEVVREGANEIVGPFPFNEPEEKREAHHARYHQTKEAIQHELVGQLPRVLQDSDGVLMAGLLRALRTSSRHYEVQRARLLPLVDELLWGRGPATPDLQDDEADAISQTYAVPSHTIMRVWRDVCGHEHHLQDWKLRPSYDPSWQAAGYAVKQALDWQSLDALSKVPAITQTYLAGLRSNDTRLPKLGPAALDNPAADLATLRHHIALLLVIADGDEGVPPWPASEQLANLAETPADAFATLNAVAELLCVRLGDAIRHGALDRFAASLGPGHVQGIAMRISSRSAHLEGTQALAAAVYHALAEVREVAGRWWSREYNKFSRPVASAAGLQKIRAVVSKYPAAFFARASCGLCTAENVGMWREERHTHLLVFDLVRKRLIGMAMLYRQVVREIDENRPSLVVRAINPTAEAVSRYDIDSIIDGVIGIANTLAKDNGCAAVAIPTLHGYDVLTNRSAVAQNFKARLATDQISDGIHPMIGHSVSATFHCYEEGRREATVSRLQIIWRAEEEVTLPSPTKPAPRGGRVGRLLAAATASLRGE